MIKYHLTHNSIIVEEQLIYNFIVFKTFLSIDLSFLDFYGYSRSPSNYDNYC
jgi:hypothetical protein